MKEPVVTNALLRCMRHDQKASPLFECVREDGSLWVWQLDGSPPIQAPWVEAIATICERLQTHLPLLKTLREGSTSMVLLIEFTSEPHLPPFEIPLELTVLTLQIGCAIELCLAPPP